MGQIAGAAIIARIREVVEDGMGLLRRVDPGRFAGGWPEGIGDDELARRGVESQKPTQVVVRRVGRHESSPPVGGNLEIMAIVVEIGVSRTVAIAEQVDDDARATLEALAMVDVDMIRQALEWPANLASASVDTPTTWPAIGSWSSTGTPVITTGVADPFGGTSAATVEDDAAGLEFVAHTEGTALVTGQAYRGIVYVKKDAVGKATRVVEFEFASGTETIAAQIDTSTGETALRATASDYASRGVYAVESPSGWWRMQLSFVSGSTTAPGALLIPAVGAGSTLPVAIDVSATGAVTFYPLATLGALTATDLCSLRLDEPASRVNIARAHGKAFAAEYRLIFEGVALSRPAIS